MRHVQGPARPDSDRDQQRGPSIDAKAASDEKGGRAEGGTDAHDHFDDSVAGSGIVWRTFARTAIVVFLVQS
jgi:hypothetical protein